MAAIIAPILGRLAASVGARLAAGTAARAAGTAAAGAATRSAGSTLARSIGTHMVAHGVSNALMGGGSSGGGGGGGGLNLSASDPAYYSNPLTSEYNTSRSGCFGSGCGEVS